MALSATSYMCRQTEMRYSRSVCHGEGRTGGGRWGHEVDKGLMIHRCSCLPARRSWPESNVSTWTSRYARVHAHDDASVKGLTSEYVQWHGLRQEKEGTACLGIEERDAGVGRPRWFPCSIRPGHNVLAQGRHLRTELATPAKKNVSAHVESGLFYF